MAGSALGAATACVPVILKVAGNAVCGRALKHSVFMTVLTSRGGVFALQRESKFRMVEVGRFPASGGMAGGAFCSHCALVEIIFLMAGITILRGGLHVCDAAVIEMAVRAGCQGVLSL